MIGDMVIYEVSVEVHPDAEEAWSDWNLREHVLDVLAQPGFVMARRYRVDGTAPDGWVRWVVAYEVASGEALDAYLSSAAVERLRGEHLARFGGVTRLARRILRPEAERFPLSA
jgi:hypothetical protein